MSFRKSNCSTVPDESKSVNLSKRVEIANQCMKHTPFWINTPTRHRLIQVESLLVQHICHLLSNEVSPTCGGCKQTKNKSMQLNIVTSVHIFIKIVKSPKISLTYTTMGCRTTPKVARDKLFNALRGLFSQKLCFFLPLNRNPTPRSNKCYLRFMSVQNLTTFGTFLFQLL